MNDIADILDGMSRDSKGPEWSRRQRVVETARELFIHDGEINVLESFNLAEIFEDAAEKYLTAKEPK